jgi:hypothetical protein
MRKGDVYRLLYPSWRGARPADEPGYSLLLPVPGDLPVFLRIALEVCGAQDPEHRVETLVLPDGTPPGFARAYERAARNWDGGPLRLLPLRRSERAVARWRKNPHLNHWMQLMTGVRAARATHAVWHDADLFVDDPQFLRGHYERCRDRRLAGLGLSEAWDDWYRRHGLDHVVSTWEMVVEVPWARSFAPWEHRGHDGEVDGRPVTFDTSFRPQTRTAPERIGLTDAPPRFVHFNHTICRYREFQRARQRGRAWEDRTFRVLLVRLLADVFDDSGWEYEAPPVTELLRGLEDPAAPVTYRAPETRDGYAAFRAQLDELADARLIGAARADALRAAVAPFDAQLAPAPA